MTAEPDPAATYAGILTGPSSVDVHDMSAAGCDCVLIRFSGGRASVSLEGPAGDLEPLLLEALGQLVTLRERRAQRRGVAWHRQRPQDLMGADAGTLAEVGRGLLTVILGQGEEAEAEQRYPAWTERDPETGEVPE